MVRPNQPPEPECCRETGQASAMDSGVDRTNSWKRTQGASQAASQSRTSLKQTSLETTQKYAGGDAVASAEPNTEETVKGEVSGDLPGSKSVAREAESRMETGTPCRPPKRQLRELSGREVQRQEELPKGKQGIRSAHSNSEPGACCPNPNQGADTTTQPAKETSAVRTTEPSWPTSLRAITKKAAQNPHHRFGGLYRLLNEAALRECFHALRKDAAPGVDGVTFKEYEQNLDGNLQNLVKRLKQKSYRARLVRRKYIPKSPGKLRPLGIPVLEDKLVQGAGAKILSAS